MWGKYTKGELGGEKFLRENWMVWLRKDWKIIFVASNSINLIYQWRDTIRALILFLSSHIPWLYSFLQAGLTAESSHFSPLCHLTNAEAFLRGFSVALGPSLSVAQERLAGGNRKSWSHTKGKKNICCRPQSWASFSGVLSTVLWLFPSRLAHQRVLTVLTNILASGDRSSAKNGRYNHTKSLTTKQ